MSDLLLRMLEDNISPTIIAEVALLLTCGPNAKQGDGRFYVYAHFGKKTGQMFYIGKGCGSRCDQVGGRNCQWLERHDNEGGFYAVPLLSDLDEAHALATEAELIRLYALDSQLTNIAGVGHAYC